jgi:hypothetical protein
MQGSSLGGFGSVAALLALSCSVRDAPPSSTQHGLTPGERIAAVTRHWRATERERGAGPPEGGVSRFERFITSTLDIDPNRSAGAETIKVEETLELKDGRRFRCEASTTVPTALRFGEWKGQPAVEVTRPAIVLDRSCSPPDYAELRLPLPRTAARFRLRDEELSPFEPATERRVYLPAD